MTFPPQHPLTLAFRDPLLERRFLRRYTRDALAPARWAALFGILLYSVVFAVNDWLVVPHLLREAWTVRGGIGALGLAVFALSYRPWFRRVWQPVYAIVLALAGVGLIYLLAIDPGPVTSGFGFNGPALLIVAAYVLFRLRFVWATAVGWAVVVAYVFVGLFVRELPVGRFVGSLIFFSTANGVGMFAAYALERYVRRLFVQAETLDEKRRENARLLDMRSRFFQNVSHELRTPLTLIAGPVQRLLDEEDLAPIVRADLELVERSATRLRGLVTELLDLARLEAGHLPLHVSENDLVAYVQGAVAGFAPMAEAKGLALRFASDRDELPVFFDSGKLDRALLNLVANAVKFTPPGGFVEVSLHADDNRARLRVRDTGTGIAADELPHLFDRFHRARAHDAVEGTGLGLPLAQALARLHGGDVSVDSTPGLGSVFELSLPLGSAHFSPEALAPAPAALPSSTVKRGRTPLSSAEPFSLPDDGRPVLLVVDDSPDIRTFVARVLADLGTVVEAEDGAAALDVARDLVPDLVVSDLMMPRLDGLGLIEALRRDPALDHIPVVMLTAKAGDESRLDGLRAGVDDYLAKPFQPNELRVRVENLLERQRRLRERFGQALAAPSEDERRRLATTASPVAVTSADEAFVARAKAVVEAELVDEHFGVDALADALGLSRRQLERKLRALVDVSPAEFVRLIRLSRAADLLGSGFGNVSEVAYAVGMSPSHFARLFREQFGVVPSEFEGGAQRPPA